MHLISFMHVKEIPNKVQKGERKVINVGADLWVNGFLLHLPSWMDWRIIKTEWSRLHIVCSSSSGEEMEEKSNGEREVCVCMRMRERVTERGREKEIGRDEERLERIPLGRVPFRDKHASYRAQYLAELTWLQPDSRFPVFFGSSGLHASLDIYFLAANGEYSKFAH